MKIFSKDLTVRSQMKFKVSVRNGDYIYQSTEVTTLSLIKNNVSFLEN